MFSCVVAGRPVLTDLQTISLTQFAFSIPSRPFFSHLVVFLLPGNALPPGTAAAVYLQIPPASGFRLLGAIANDKQSAVFKVNTGSPRDPDRPSDDDMLDDAAAHLSATHGQVPAGPNIVLGISVEPVEGIQAQLATLRSASDAESSALARAQPQLAPSAATRVLAQRIIKNAFNFLSSFADGKAGSEVVPLKAFQDWWVRFEKRVELDPSFLEREE